MNAPCPIFCSGTFGAAVAVLFWGGRSRSSIAARSAPSFLPVGDRAVRRTRTPKAMPLALSRVTIKKFPARGEDESAARRTWIRHTSESRHVSPTFGEPRCASSSEPLPQRPRMLSRSMITVEATGWRGAAKAHTAFM